MLMSLAEWGPAMSSYMESVCVLLFDNVGCEVALVFALLLLKIIAIIIEETAILAIKAIARELEDIMHLVLALDDCLPSVSVG